MAKKKKKLFTIVSPSPPPPTASRGNDISTSIPSCTMAPPVFESFLSSLKTYYNTETLSDVIVVCEGEEFKVHKVILSAHSEYFAKQLSGAWKESLEGKIDIKDFDASVVEGMLRFMYSFDYASTCGTSSMVFDAQMYQIADKYQIPSLKAHSMSRFGAAIATGWDMDDFSVAVSVVYNSTPSDDRSLRDLAVETSCANIEKLLQHDDFCKLLRETPDFSADLIPVLCDERQPTIQRYQCPFCENTFLGEYGRGRHYCQFCGRGHSDWDQHHV